MRILHVASELAPYSKTGGLGEVASSLPRAIAGLDTVTGSTDEGGHDEVAVVAPAYRVEPERFGLERRAASLGVPMCGTTIETELLEGRLPGAGGAVRAWLVDHPIYRRAGLYGEGGSDYPDNAIRFALLCRAALAIARQSGFRPDVIHAHDWQAAATLLYARAHEDDALATTTGTVFTIHNLAFQGLFPSTVLSSIGIRARCFHADGVEFHGRVSLLKAGLGWADRITTVSPRYAREIQTPEYGCGLDGLLHRRADRLSGILNGLDYEQWNPACDGALAASYRAGDLDGKRVCKAALQREFGLPVAARVPLTSAVTRLTEQKGSDLVAEVLERLAGDREMQFVLVGNGDRAMESRLAAVAARYPTKIAVRIGYEDDLAHRVYAGSDLFVMPSRFEPCGLGQLQALRYGAVPVVRATGGLDDTVVDYDPARRTGTGFLFAASTVGALEATWRRALRTYEREEEFAGIVQRGMAEDYSWGSSARAYRKLYESVCRRGSRGGAAAHGN